MSKLLLHTCCGPCFLGVASFVSDKFSVTNLFYNPNIQPRKEYQKRLANLKIAAAGKSEDIWEQNYDSNEHEIALGENKVFPERCQNCYRLRLEQTAKVARTENFDYFSTTLLISPYQSHEDLKRIGREIARKNKIEFYYHDWRPSFKAGQEMARRNGIYRQKYCGCRYSLSESSR